MTRTRKIASIKYGDFKLEIYDYDAFLEALKVLVVVLESGRNSSTPPRIHNRPRRTGVLRKITVSEDRGRVALEVGGDLPSYVVGNPWVKVISEMSGE